MPPFVDRVGRRYGRLTVKGQSSRNPRTLRIRWSCLCDCGAIVVVDSNNLSGGNTNSCGCFTKARKHGLSKSPEFGAWRQMRGRCYTKTLPKYKDYGGRGITVCERWGDFNLFYQDMGPRPSPDHSLERMDNDGPYSPQNCKWATQQEQIWNRRVTRFHEYNGQKLTARQIYNTIKNPPVQFRTFQMRITQHGWPISKAISTPHHWRGGVAKGAGDKAVQACD